MKVRTKLGLCALIPFALVVALNLGLLRLASLYERTARQLAAAERLAAAAVDLKRAAHNWLVSGDPGAETLLRARHEAMGRMLGRLAPVRDPEAAVLERLDAAHHRLAGLLPPAAEEEAAPAGGARQRLRETVDGMVADAAEFSDLRHRLAPRRQYVLVAGLIGAIIVLPGVLSGVALLLGRRVSQGLAAMENGTREVAAGDLDHEVPAAGRDEFGALAGAFNEMTRSLRRARAALEREVEEHRRKAEDLREGTIRLGETLETLRHAQGELVRQERLFALRQVSSGIVRDFNEALTPVLGLSEMLLGDPERLADAGRMEEYLRIIHGSAARAAGVIRQLECYFGDDRLDAAAPVDMNLAVREAVALTRPRWKDQQEAAGLSTMVETRLAAVPAAHGQAGALRELVASLLHNAVEALPGGGRIVVATGSEDGWVTLEVADDGVGMSEADRLRCTEPFFTTKPKASGLGLTLVSGIVRRHGGELEVDSGEGRGTRVRVRLPAAAVPVVVAEPADRPEPEAPPPGRKVLLVDDDPWVLVALRSLLERDGHKVSTASTGTEGLERLAEVAPDLVITDRALPDVSGDHVAREVKRLAPGTPVVMLTGFGSVMMERGEQPDAVDVLLAKPYTRAGLRAALAEAWDGGGHRPDAGRREGRAGMTLVEMGIVVSIVGLLAVLAMPYWFGAKDRARTGQCIHNLRAIDMGKELYAIEAGRANGAPVWAEDLDPYLKRPFASLVEPLGGAYTINVIGVPPTCSVGPPHELP